MAFRSRLSQRSAGRQAGLRAGVTTATLMLAAVTHVAFPAEVFSSDDRTPVAMLLGQPIYLDEFQPPAQWKTREGKTDAEYAASLRDWRLQQVKDKIWAAVMERFCHDHDCEPTEEEYQAFQQGMERARAQHPFPNGRSQEPVIPPQEYERMHAGLQQELPAPGLTDDRRKELEQAVTKLEELQDKKLGDPTRDGARVWIRAWKLNRALYQRYGGKVIWQQAGLEPLDAYQAWLKENEHNGAFAILDPDLKERFWRYFTIGHVNVGPEFLKETGLKDPFEKPWWMMTTERAAGDT